MSHSTEPGEQLSLPFSDLPHIGRLSDPVSSRTNSGQRSIPPLDPGVRVLINFDQIRTSTVGAYGDIFCGLWLGKDEKWRMVRNKAGQPIAYATRSAALNAAAYILQGA